MNKQTKVKSIPKFGLLPKLQLNEVFGPSLNTSRPIPMKSNFTKVIHYDCGLDTNKSGDENDDIPDEDEIYIKENLLNKKKEDCDIEHDDDLSLVNINVSKLLSSSGSNSKNSITFNSKEQSKNSSSNNNTFLTNNNKQNTSSNKINNSIQSKKGAMSNNSNKGKLFKQKLKSKRKIIYDKLIDTNNKSSNTKNSQSNSYINKSNSNTNTSKERDSNLEEELLDKVEDDLNVNKSNVRVTNITNIILNVKDIPHKSLKKNAATPNSKDFMMRDMKSLHLITQKALTTSTNAKLNSADSFDDERRSFINFRNNSNKNELYINDNSDFNLNAINDINNMDNKKEEFINKRCNTNTKLSQIINIININNNYSLQDNKHKKNYHQNNYISSEPQNEAFRLAKTKLSKYIPNNPGNSYSKFNKKNMPLKDFITSIKTSNKNKKEQFIAIGKNKKI